MWVSKRKIIMSKGSRYFTSSCAKREAILGYGKEAFKVISALLLWNASEWCQGSCKFVLMTLCLLTFHFSNNCNPCYCFRSLGTIRMCLSCKHYRKIPKSKHCGRESAERADVYCLTSAVEKKQTRFYKNSSVGKAFWLPGFVLHLPVKVFL